MTGTSSRSGKTAIEFAKTVAKSRGVEVLGWNDDPGKEFVTLSGAGDRLQTFQEEMKAEGWYIWQADPENEGHFLDIALYPPPAESPLKERSDVVVDDAENSALPAGLVFHYSGLTGYFLRALGVFSILPVMIVWENRWTMGWSPTAKIVLSIIAVLLTAMCLSLFRYVVVDADRSNLTFRFGFRGKKTVIAMSEIRKANVFRKRDRTIYTSRYISINLKSGKTFELCLPRQKQQELIALLRACIRAQA